MQYTLLGLAAITIIMVTRSLVRVLDELIGAGFLLDDLITVVSLLGTMLTIYALPVSFLLGVLLAIGRMAADVEITAMRACGVGILGLLLPIGGMGVLLSLVAFELTVDVEPAARREMSAAVRRMLVRGASVEAGRFNTVGNRTLYVDERESAGRLRGIVISDRTDPERPFVVFAEAGEMKLDDDAGELSLVLERGDVHVDLRQGVDDRYQQVRFETLEYRIDMTSALGASPTPRPREMSEEDLRALIAKIDAGQDPGPLREEPEHYAANLAQRYAMPAAPALFAWVGVPLAMGRKRGARAYGVIVGAVLAFGYYALHQFAELLATEQGFPPHAVAWVPNLLFLGLGAVLLWRSQRAA